MICVTVAWRRVAATPSFSSTSWCSPDDQARPAAAFTDSVGVNTHYVNSVYTGQNAYSFAVIDQKLADLGVRHVRDNTDGAEPSAFARLDGLYATYGVRAILVPNSTASGPAGMLGLVKAHPVYEAVEGLNEGLFGTVELTEEERELLIGLIGKIRAAEGDVVTQGQTGPA